MKNIKTKIQAITAIGLFAVAAQSMAAAPKVVTVPWRGPLDLPHETYNGKQIHLKGVAHNLAVGATASWNPGDGTGPFAVTPGPDASGSDYDLGIVHTYPDSAAGTPFTATLTVCNGADCASDTYKVVVRDRSLGVEINIGIDEGLWNLHRNQTRNSASTDDGRFVWSSSYSRDGMVTASAVQAFQINNHFQTTSPNIDPYADTVKRGLRYMFSRLVTMSISVQPAGNPDTNGNGIGVSAGNTVTPPSGVSSRPIYETGQFMDAIVASKTPNEPVPAGTPLAGLPSPSGAPSYTYFDAVQDMIDAYAWGQVDSSSYRGGWRYSWNSQADNSACQWAAIGILAARDLWGATVPAFVYSENLIWLSASQTPVPPSAATGYGYTGRGEGVATSPSGLVQAIMDGIPKTDAGRWVGVENRMASQWNSWYRDTTDYYRLFAVAKSMRLALPDPIVQMAQGTANQINWFEADCANPDACSGSETWGVARTILRDQNADGQFTGSYRTSGLYRTAWGVIILTGSLHLEPVAVAVATPNPGAAGVPINFDGSGSYHTDPDKSIVSYEWDWNDDGVFDETGVAPSHAFSCAVLPCTYPVTLKVTDNSSPVLVDTVTINVQITNPPHPPTADADGPYMACTNENINLDGSGSFDIDESLGDSIIAYGWETDFVQPLDFNDATGVSAVGSFPTAGTFDIGLRVTDNSAAVFGGSNLTDEDFTTAKIRDCDCVDNLAARAKSGKVQLTWEPVAGAAGYDIYRSTKDATSGFTLIAAGHVTDYATYLDTGLVDGTHYWYRVVPKDASGAELCGSIAVDAVPQGRGRRA